jgi:hypothetical protein
MKLKINTSFRSYSIFKVNILLFSSLCQQWRYSQGKGAGEGLENEISGVAALVYVTHRDKKKRKGEHDRKGKRVVAPHTIWSITRCQTCNRPPKYNWGWNPPLLVRQGLSGRRRVMESTTTTLKGAIISIEQPNMGAWVLMRRGAMWSEK